MNDIQRSRRPAVRSPRGSRQSTQLGELEFSDWYEIPVFEPDEDELTEEIATTGRGPRRMMARAKLARDARRAKRRPEWDSPVRRSAAPAAAAAPTVSEPATRPEPAPAPTRPAAAKPAVAKPETTKPETTKPAAEPEVPAAAQPAPAAAEPTREIEPTPAPAAEPAPAPAAKQAPAAAEKPAAAEEPKPAEEPGRAAEPAPAAKPAPARAPKAAPKPAPAPAMAQVRDEETWMTSGPALTEESMQLDLDRESVWRRRLNNFLDRWAASEMAVAHRLDDSLERVMSPNLPKSIPDLVAAATKRGGSR